MFKQQDFTNKLAHGTQQITLSEYTEKSYLNYAMYVILDRALPHIADGLKPVQRRIIYAMSELGLAAGAKFKKSVRTIGDVIGKYHPHGDVACYEALVLMAQEFSYRYPLIFGQGNFGSIDDPKSFAAMRYTEARLSAYAEILLAELPEDTVNWQQNFDGTLLEPVILPAQLPNLLLNGASGIAVGMATDIPPHNLGEVSDAVIYLLDNPQASIEDVCQFIKGPDFPAGAEITSPATEILEMYRQGYGALQLRAVYHVEKHTVVITQLPYQVSAAKIITQIVEQMQAKKLPMISDIRDESDHDNPVRIVIIPRSQRIDYAALMDHLFATTALAASVRINMNVIGMNGQPVVKSLLAILQEWLEFRIATVIKRLSYRLQKIQERLHILAGLMVVYLNLDQVIHIVRYEDEPAQVLQATFALSERQVAAILDTKLRHLASLEEQKIRNETLELSQQEQDLVAILGNDQLLRQVVREELRNLSDKLRDPRRSVLQERQAAKIWQEPDNHAEAVTVILSANGWVRVAKGHDIDATSLSYKAGDSLHTVVAGWSNQKAIFLDTAGKAYTATVGSLPSARGQGEPLTSKFPLSPGATWAGVVFGDDEQYCVLSSQTGYGFITKLHNLVAKQRTGKQIISIVPDNLALPPHLLPAEHNIEDGFMAALSKAGALLIVPLSELPILAKGKGNKIMSLGHTANAHNYLLATAILTANQNLVILNQDYQVLITLSPQAWRRYVGSSGARGKTLRQVNGDITKIVPRPQDH